jgi:hypothetical protein
MVGAALHVVKELAAAVARETGPQQDRAFPLCPVQPVTHLGSFRQALVSRTACGHAMLRAGHRRPASTIKGSSSQAEYVSRSG